MRSISVRNLSKTYGFYEKEAGLLNSVKALFRGKKVYVEAVGGIDFDAEIGEVIGFIGPNGAGKTTTLKMLAGVLYPTGGHVEVMGFVPSRREKAFLKNITFISGQRNRLFWDLPAEDYFQFIKLIYEIPEERFRKNAENLVELLGIGPILKVPQRKLSFGERKRCELVAALLHDPRLIFLDEPTNALDLINARKIREFIREKGREGNSTILLTSHNIADIKEVCERVLIIHAGKIVFDGSPQDLARFHGGKKRIKILFEGPLSPETVAGLGSVVARNGQEVLLEVEPELAAQAAANLIANFPVKDISITSPPLAAVIEAIYKTGSHPPGP